MRNSNRTQSAGRLSRPLFLLLAGLLLGAGSGSLQAQELLYEFTPHLEPMHALPFFVPAGPKVGLVLSGGGSRGMAHIGVLKALEEAGLTPAFVTGVSAGAVIGGLYAAGLNPDELEQLARDVDWQDLLTDSPERTNLFLPQKEERASYLLQIRFSGGVPILPTSYMMGQRMATLFSDLTFKGDYLAAGDFDALAVPFRAVSTDLLTGEKVVLGSGNLAEALMASSAVPVLIAAIRIGDHLLVDGGLVDAIPVGVVEELGADVIIASDVSAALRPPDRLGTPVEILDQIMSITMRGPNALSLERADLVIAPNLGDHLSSDFADLDTLVAAGYAAARRAIELWEGSEASRHLVRLAGVHPEHGPALRVVGIETEGGSEEQRRRARTFLERELGGRSADPVGLEAAARRLMEDGTLAGVRLQVLQAPGEAPGSEARVTLTARLTSRPLIEEIRFVGASLYDPPDLRRAVQSRPGEPLDCHLVAGDVRRLEHYHAARGYPLALVREVRFDERSGGLSFILDEARIEEISIEGLEHTREMIIRRDLPFRVGEPSGAHSIREIVDDIYSSGLFERVSIQPERTAGGGLAIRVRVEERPRHVARIGLHYLEEQKTEAFLEYRNENLLGMAGTLSLRGLTGSRRTSLGMQARIDRLFSTFLSWQLAAGWDREEIHTYAGQVLNGTYEDERYSLSATVGQQVQRMGMLSFGFWAEDIHARTIDGLFNVSSNLNLRGFLLRTIIDSQDRRPFPTSGVRHEFLYESTPGLFGSESSYVRLFLSMESFATFGRHTFHPRILFGTADATLPFVNWFRLGGLDSFYGYARDQIRGRQVLLISGEYRFRIPWRPIAPVHLGVRYDWGGGWEEADEVAFSDLISGIGLKIALDSPIGPLEVAYGLREGGYGRFYAGLGFHF